MDDCIKTNAVCCRPINNRTPTITQIKCCAPNVYKCIEKNKPKVILALGSSAITSLLSHKFDKGLGGVSKWQGHAIPDREFNAWICPTFHPSYIMRDTTPEIAERFYMDDIERAVSLLNVPTPKYEKEQNNNSAMLDPRDTRYGVFGRA